MDQIPVWLAAAVAAAGMTAYADELVTPGSPSPLGEGQGSGLLPGC
jgi:hypothetical protein